MFGLRPDSAVVKMFRDGTRVPFAPARSGSPAAITVLSNGRVFTVTHTGELAVYSAAGVREATHTLPDFGGGWSLAVGAGSCTVYYTKRFSVGRFNVCTGAPMPDFGSPSPAASEIHALPGGDVLLMIESVLWRYNSMGSRIRAIMSGDQAATNGNDLFVARMSENCEGESIVFRVSLITGQLISSTRIRNGGTPWSLAAVQDVVSDARVPDTPTVGEFALLLLTAALAFGGVFLLRR